SVRIASSEDARAAAAFSTFVLDAADPETAVQLYESIRQAKSSRSQGRSFDVEIPESLAPSLEWLKSRGVPCQMHGSNLLGTVEHPEEISELSGTMSKTVI